MTVAEAIRAAAARLARTGDTARLDAELLMAHALGASRSELLLRHMADPVPGRFAELVERRAAREPLAYITGEQEFFGRTFAVTRDVLIPRGDSETVVAAALDLVVDRPGLTVLDLGTGSGALLLTMLAERPRARGTGLDASDRALAVARGNARRLGLEGRSRFLSGDWRRAGWNEGLGRFDLVLCNPPYVEEGAALEPDVRDYEPHAALFAGPDGLDDYRRVIPALPALLAEGGVAVLEIGAAQGAAATRLAEAAGFAVEIRPDLAGRPRAAILR
ncbi:peptide chain release factor N(5)-glutamine methyltransferase [Erythrobacter sp. HL-111]|uniref:peptide chain release factor N(5)-glutamine methyltransferase n=1 Tax=Erythrobacter sp. HL-111 TaxID=1798193 RepID=UPI0006D9DF37|nr:peptide chain release factor N(5)-glutamine methyltransferase [Erythrobacter sp. HL-111]KPP94063.1 MAG: release factor glutamine methyltransferase HemK [Erythrobacteraceae bacterium HL-111]SDS60374.1 [protein release factor]-glutamine N5-methyltransferase [Erythrobacter sp. HL-111]